MIIKDNLQFSKIATKARTNLAQPRHPLHRRLQIHAIEPRMLFDGAAAATVDLAPPDDAPAPAPLHPDAAAAQSDAAPAVGPAPATGIDQTAGSDPAAASLPAPGAGENAATPAGRTLLVIDPQVAQWQTLVQGAAPGTQVLVLTADADPLGQIAAALDGRRDYASIQVVSHGASDGRLLLGNQTLDTGTLASHAAELGRIGAALHADGDILLYGCDIADTADGMRFLQGLADATGADVAASSDDTGAARLGGNWSLESRIGDIETTSAIAATAREAWDHLLAPGPSVALSMPAGTTLVGETFTVTATFSNGGSDAGYAPYIDLFVPARGADGGLAPDGLTITGAAYLGAALTRTTITLTAGDIAAGQVEHPYFTDSGGQHRVTIPAGLAAGDQLVVIQLPFGSFTPGQPAVAVTVTGTLSALADVGTPLSMIARGGFRYGADPLDNPAADPSLQGATATGAIDPGFYRLTTTYIGPENETATGPNHLRAYRIDLDVAAGQTVSGIDLSSILSPAMQFTPLAGMPASVGGMSLGAAPGGGWSNVDGVLLSGAGTSVATPAATTPGGTVTRLLSTPVTGTASSTDASMVVAFHVPELDASGIPVIDPVSGDAVVLTAGSAAHATWTPTDSRDAAQAIAETVAAAHQLTARSIAVQKGESIAADVGAGGLSAGDTLRFTLDMQVSDFFAFGYDAGGTPDLALDTLSDGLTMLDATTTPAAANPTMTITGNSSVSSASLQRGVHYTVTLDGQGREQIVFSGAGLTLVGDLFADPALQGATTVRIGYDARVLEEFRITANDAAGNPVPISSQPAINDGDHIANRVTVQGIVLDAQLDPSLTGLQTEADGSAVVDTIANDPVAITLTSINGAAPTTPARASPGDEVSYLIRYVVGSGDFEDLELSAYLPKPVFSTIDPDVDGTPNAFTPAGGAWDPSPAVGRYSVRALGGDGSGLATPPTADADAGTNSLTFHLGNREDATNLPLTIEIAFTVRVSTDPFADELQLTAQSFGDSQNTAVTPSNSAAIVQLTLAEPALRLFKGAVGDDVIEASSVFDPVYSVSNPGSRIRPAGDASANPLLGTVTPADVALLDNDIEDVDAGDTVRFAMMIVNDGTSARGAFDVKLRDQLPDNLDPASVANLRIVRGDGTAVAYTRLDGAPATAADLFGIGIRLIDDPGADGLHGTGDDRGAIAGSLDAAGNPVTDGSNVVLVIYDATVRSDAAANTMAGSRARVLYYTGSPGGPSFIDPLPDGLYDDATVGTPLPLVDKIIVGTDRDDTITAGNNVVIGERVTYEVVMTVPEGTTLNAQFVDTLDPGLSFVSVDSIVVSPGLSFGSGLPAPGSIVPTSSGGDANRITVSLGAITNSNANNAQAETLTIRYTAVVDNVSANRQGALRNNDARLSFDTGGAVVVPITVSDGAPDMRIVEPSLAMSLAASTTQPDAGDVVTFTLTLTAAGGRPPAFDVELDVANLVPAGFTYESGSLTQTGGPAAAALAFGGAGIAGSWTRLDAGQSIVLTYQARVGESVVVADSFGQAATARFSSLPGTGNGDLSPLAPASAGDFERTGSTADPGGVLNDYVVTTNATVTVVAQTPVLILMASSEADSAGSAVVPGEVVRYRMVVQVPEGTEPGAELRPVLPPGLRFVNDGNVTIAFVADGTGIGGGIDSSTLSGGTLEIVGGGVSATAIASLVPTQVLPGAAIVDGTGTPIAAGAVMASGTAPRLLVGDLTNADRDANKEFVVVEFNAIVDNAAGNAAGTTRNTTFQWVSSGTRTSNTVGVNVREPSIVGLDKRVVAVSGNQVTFEVVFSNSNAANTEEAHDVRLVDEFAGAVNLALVPGSVQVTVPGGVTWADEGDGDTVDLSFQRLAPGQGVTVRYIATMTDPTVVVPVRDAVVTWTSLSAGGVTLTDPRSPVATATTGERNGDTSSYGGAANTYRRNDPAGLGVIRGTLWDETSTHDHDVDPEDTPLAGQTVQARWAGRDGSFNTSDDQVYTAVTDASGNYVIGGAPAGQYQIIAPTMPTDPSLGGLRVYHDTGASGSRTDGLITVTLGEAALLQSQDFAYLQVNDPPAVTVGGARSATEDLPMAFTGADSISVADPDARVSTSNTVTLSVLHGNLTVGAAGAVAVAGNGGASVVLTGSIADIDATLASLTYLNTLHYNGADTLTVRADDRGNTGDADNDGVPSQPVADNLTDTRTVAITVVGVNDPPVAVGDARTTNQNSPASGQVLAPDSAQIAAGDRTDTDPDLPYGDTLSVQGVQAGSVAGPLTGNVGTTVNGALGALALAADGRYTWTPGAAARALPAGTSGADVFTYTIRDAAGITSTAQITITVDGLNDAPGAQPDARSTTEDAPPITGNAVRGDGVAGGQPGDVADDDIDTGDTLSVQGVAAGSPYGLFTGGLGTPVSGDHGALTLNADGSYTYATDARAQPLVPGQTVQDVFSYTVRDAAGATSTTTITISISGEDDDVQANPDVRTIPEPVGTVVPLTGNAITGGAAGEAADVTIDPVPITVAGVTAGMQSGPLTTGTGSSIAGDWGTLVLDADGSYSYTPDARAQTIPLGTTASDVFSYTVTIPNGSTSTTTLSIDIVGDDDAPIAHPDANRIAADATAPATGNVIGGAAGNGGSAGDTADADIDSGDVLTVAGVSAASAGGPLGGPFTGSAGAPVSGAHGTLVLDADGRYRYTVDGGDAAVIGLAPGQTLIDAFGYTVDDGHGGQATTTLTITIDGRNDPPAGQDRTIELTEDTPVPLAPADFGFGDPDAGATFAAVRIDSLPASGTLLLNGVPVVAGQVVAFASIGQLSYQPAHDANRDNLAAPPSFRFSVQDQHGAFDPQPNTIDFVIAPVNDPPTAPRIAVTIEGSATEGSPTSAIGAVPAPTDPDVPAQTLTVRIDAVPDPVAGRFVLPDGRTLAAGMVLAPGELQELSFVPNRNNPAPAGTDGLIDAGALRLTVGDGHGGATEGEIAVRVRPVGGGDPVPPLRGPQLPPPPPSGIAVPGIATTPAAPLAAALSGLSPAPAGSDAWGDMRRLEPLSGSEFDPTMPWAIGPLAARTVDSAPSEAAADTAAKSSRVQRTVQQAADADSGDCLPQLKPKARPKAVARHVFEQKLRQAQPFSEQLKSERQRLRPPVRLPVRQPAGRVC